MHTAKIKRWHCTRTWRLGRVKPYPGISYQGEYLSLGWRCTGVRIRILNHIGGNWVPLPDEGSNNSPTKSQDSENSNMKLSSREIRETCFSNWQLNVTCWSQSHQILRTDVPRITNRSLSNFLLNPEISKSLKKLSSTIFWDWFGKASFRNDSHSRLPIKQSRNSEAVMWEVRSQSVASSVLKAISVNNDYLLFLSSDVQTLYLNI